ncbi:hypothetical protein AB4391_01300 [Vibrio lentus]|uniref:hypothetical protein n=1 Tax=Vibrio lentus TaxID=136468 RepID=UPI0010557BAE|nr:hypothetical protein [Vibrio lentus]
MNRFPSKTGYKRLLTSFETRVTSATHLEDLLGRYRFGGQHHQSRQSIKVANGLLVERTYRECHTKKEDE